LTLRVWQLNWQGVNYRGNYHCMRTPNFFADATCVRVCQ